MLEPPVRDAQLERAGGHEPAAVHFLFGWLNFLPRRFVDGLVKNPERVDRFAWESFFFPASLLRLLSTVFRPPDFRGRDHIRRMLGQVVYIGRLMARDWWRQRGMAPSPQASKFAVPPSRPPTSAAGRETARPEPVVLGRRSGGKITASH